MMMHAWKIVQSIEWIKYIADYWAFKEKWCHAYRDEKMRGHSHE